MWLSWRERLAQEPGLRDMSQWPQPAIDGLSHSQKRGYLRNRLIVARILRHEPMAQVATRYGLSLGRISQLMKRCLAGEDSTPPALHRALVPYRHLVPKVRQAPLPQMGSADQAASHAFQYLLAVVPRLKQNLDDILREALKQTRHAQRVSPRSFHGDFKRLLAEAHWPRDRYPYTHASVAYESLRRYLHQRQEELLQDQRYQAKAKAAAPRMDRRSLKALDEIEIDEHTIDAKTSLALSINEGLRIALRLARGSVLIAKDKGTHCYLGYFLAPTRHCSQFDLLALLENCLTPWQPLALTTPGFQYLPGAGFPSGIAGDFPMSFGLVKLDNAWIHMAHSVRALLCDTYGAAMNFGLPRQPNNRALVEAAFNYIEQHITHRVDSTTGSHPTDPRREPRQNRALPPLLDWHMLDEALSIVLANFNSQPLEVLHNRSPLDVLREDIEAQYVRYVPRLLRVAVQPFCREQEVTVHTAGGQHGVAFINFTYSRYSGPGLYDPRLTERRLRIRYDWRDLRSVQAFTRDGVSLGWLKAPDSWQRFPFSVTTRCEIHRLNLRDRRARSDPLSAYFQHLLEHKDTEQGAQKVLRVYQEFTRGSDTPTFALGEPPRLPLPESTPVSMKPRQQLPRSWRPNTADRLRS